MNIELITNHIKYFFKVFGITFGVMATIYLFILSILSFVYMEMSPVVSGLDITTMGSWGRALLLIPFLLIPLGVAGYRLLFVRLNFQTKIKGSDEQ